MMHTVPCAYLSIIGSMIMSDGAFGDEASAWAHMQGAFALLEARKKPGVEWRFYDALHKRILMIAMSLFYISHHGDENEDEFGSYELDIGIIDMYTQLSNEYLRAPLLTGSPHAASRKDGPILSWLDKSLQQFRSDKPSKQSTAASGKSSKLDEKEKRMWTKAVSAYAMTVGSMDWFGMDQDGAASLTIASVELNRFRTWCGDMVEEWLATRKLMTRDIALQIWKKMEWFQSDEGLRVVREIALMARRDGVHQRMRVVPDEEKEREREGSEQDDAAVALEIMYI
ncbi:hypothetical protein GQ53DRAFT_746064 [Thozetella sp. PMI_491]|nr:hypothetical protein GQ53DRAFT_746064 [Thozetella sp. PMI_491]